MKTLKFVTASLLIPFGLVFLLMMAIELNDPKSPQKEKEGALIAGLFLGLPPLAIGTWLGAGLYGQIKEEKRKRLAAETNKINEVFYRLLQANDNLISVMQLALEAQITGEQATQFLNAKAQEFNGTFEIDERGGIFYHFPL